MNHRSALVAVAVAAFLCSGTAWAQLGASSDQNRERMLSGDPDGIPLGLLSDALDKSPANLSGTLFPFAFRSIDGSDNNPNHPELGAAETPLLRLTTVDYGDLLQSPAGSHRVSAREVSNICVAQAGPVPNSANASDFLWQWGQFIDHDMDLSAGASPAEPFNIAVPAFDPFFDPDGDGDHQIGLSRTLYEVIGGVRQQINEISSYIDASNVYGSNEARANELRALDGTGRMKTSAGNLLPFNVNGFRNDPTPFDPTFFLAGDVRSNEQAGLTAMHTLFVREHNWWAGIFNALFPFLDGDEVYELSRGMVSAEIQAITYREFLPVLLGPNGLRPYRGYKRNVDPSISNVFATAAYRVGHTMLSSTLLRLQANGQPIPAGNLPLQAAFFNPSTFVASGLEPLLRGLAAQPAQEIDNFIVDDVRNFLFGAPGADGFDLASLNIQRGRDHGLPSYNQVRIDFGLAAKASFADVNPDAAVQANLAAAYATVDDIDIWVGGLAEPHVGGGVVGETFAAILSDQFERLRGGDRFYFERYMPEPFLTLVKESTLSRIIKRNTGVGGELQANAFRAP